MNWLGWLCIDLLLIGALGTLGTMFPNIAPALTPLLIAVVALAHSRLAKRQQEIGATVNGQRMAMMQEIAQLKRMLLAASREKDGERKP